MHKVKKIARKLFPALFGLIIYLTIRAITDSAYMSNHFSVIWHVLLVEISCSVLAGYLYIYLIRYFSRERRKLPVKEQFSVKSIIREFGHFYIYVCLLTNATLTLISAVTDDGLSWHDFVTINIIPVFYTFTAYLVVRGNYFIRAYIGNKVQLERLARDKAEEELKFLKGQYQPHFLFNALNTIYFQMDESVDAAKKSIEKLSDLLRYRLYDDDSVKVSLVKEIEYLKKYIQFQAIRSSESLKITTEFNQPLNGEQVYPFLFLPCIENAFKYVSGEMWIDIVLSIKNSKIEFVVSNSVDSKVLEMSNNGGIGLQNLEKRLTLLYENKFSFEVTNDKNTYTAKIQIDIA